MLFINILLLVSIAIVGLFFITRNSSNVQRLRGLYDFTVKEADEKKVKIKSMYLYPVRGIPGTQVKSIQMTNSGPLNDRLWVIINAKTMRPLASHNNELQTYLRQQFCEPNKVKLYIQEGILPAHLQPSELP